LERKGDQLRSGQSFLDALDYLRAHAAKSPNNPKLLNKIGIVQLQMVRLRRRPQELRDGYPHGPRYADAHNNLGVDYYLQNRRRQQPK